MVRTCEEYAESMRSNSTAYESCYVFENMFVAVLCITKVRDGSRAQYTPGVETNSRGTEEG
jgi:hypothetical protein